MDMKTFDNFKTLIIVFVLIALLYLFVFMKKEESFEVTTKFSTIPAPSVIIKQAENDMAPRIVSPSGPNPPNARIPELIARENDVYNIVPNDPQDELYGSQNIQDNLRYPERSFGPGIVNSGSKLLVSSGVASTKMLNTSQAIQSFSTELVQNGGLFGNVGADDTKTNPNYASF
jgi:hypothetical protein